MVHDGGVRVVLGGGSLPAGTVRVGWFGSERREWPLRRLCLPRLVWLGWPLLCAVLGAVLPRGWLCGLAVWRLTARESPRCGTYGGLFLRHTAAPVHERPGLSWVLRVVAGAVDAARLVDVVHQVLDHARRHVESFGHQQDLVRAERRLTVLSLAVHGH
jgi:hypothetical protein